MKKNTLFAIASLCFLLYTSSGSAQSEESNKNFDLGVSAGYSLATIENYKKLGLSVKSGFNVAVSGAYKVVPFFGIKTKLIYDNKGFGDVQIGNEIFSRGNGNVNVNYLTIPLMGSFYLGDEVVINLNAGGYVGFLLNAKETVFDSDITGLFEKTDFGVTGGVGSIFPLNEEKSSSLFFEYELQYALSDPPNHLIRHGLNFGILFSL